MDTWVEHTEDIVLTALLEIAMVTMFASTFTSTFVYSHSNKDTSKHVFLLVIALLTVQAIKHL